MKIGLMSCRAVSGALVVLSITAMLPAFGQTSAGRMPPIKSETLSERELTLPADLPADRTLVLMPFTQAQQAQVDTWVAGMGLATGSLPWIETPVIEPSNAFVRAMINSGMRRGIPDARMRERTITLYTDGVALRRAMGLPGDGKAMAALVLDRSGKVLVQVTGSHTSEKATLLLGGLESP